MLAVIPFVAVKAGFRQDLWATAAAVTGVGTAGCRANFVPRLFFAPCEVEGGILMEILHLRVGQLVTAVVNEPRKRPPSTRLRRSEVGW